MKCFYICDCKPECTEFFGIHLHARRHNLFFKIIISDVLKNISNSGLSQARFNLNVLLLFCPENSVFTGKEGYSIFIVFYL